MHSKALLAASLACLASANVMHVDVVRQEVQVLKARQTDDLGGASCLSALNDIMTVLPTAPAAVSSVLASITIVDPCKVTVPAIVSPLYEEYRSTVLSWWSSYSEAWSSVASQCPDYLSAAPDLAAPACTGGSGDDESSTSASQGAEPTGESTTGSSPSSTGASSSSNNNTNAAPRNTGLIGLSVALAGFLGAVAML